MNFNIQRPTAKELEAFYDKVGKLENHATHHVLNTPKALANLTKEVTAYVFTGDPTVRMFAGYADGLILQYEISKIIVDKNQPRKPLIGHTNKINHMLVEKD